MTLRIGPQVEDALRTASADRRPVVVLESTIFSSLGLPAPHNADALRRCIAAVESESAVAALTAVLDGIAWVGVPPELHHRVLASTHKVAERDLPVAVGQRWSDGVTTVSASVALAAAAGIPVFATGGIGGVHRDDHLTGDVSADLAAIARHSVVTVTAGAKAFLDLAKTLERLDTLGVPVLGFGTDRFPAFYVRDSGLPVPHRVDSAAEVAAIYQARQALGGGGVLVANPIPEVDELPREHLDTALQGALADAARERITGPGLTPFILGRIADATQGRSVPANLALAESNARVAAKIAAALASSPT